MSSSGEEFKCVKLPHLKLRLKKGGFYSREELMRRCGDDEETKKTAGQQISVRNRLMYEVRLAVNTWVPNGN